MKVYNFVYSNEKNLKEEIEKNNSNLYENILVQVFSSSTDINFIKKLQQEILTFLPEAKIIGATTSGGICENRLEDSTILSFCQFDKTVVDTYIIEGFKDSFTTGRELLKKLPNPNHKKIKVGICFTDSLLTNGEEFLNGISSINPDLIISGGMASDNLKYSDNYVFNETKIVSHGAVLATLKNPELEVLTQHSFNWQPVGKPHTITKAVKNRLYTIDDKSTLEFYKDYLGENIDEFLPGISLEFPLIITNHNFLKGRAVVEVHDDGSFSYSGNISEGDTIKFGYANADLMLDKNNENIFELVSSNVDAIFIYSCIARKVFLKDNIAHEIEPYKRIAPSCGFFTYGEFYHESTKDEKSKLLNQTMTILALSESKNNPSEKKVDFEAEKSLSNEKEVVLNHIISKITSELDDLTINLKKTVEEEVKKNEEKDAILNITQAQAEIGYMLEMIAHQWRQPLSGISSIASILHFKNSLNQLGTKEIDELSSEILNLSKYASDTIEDFRKLFKNDQRFEDIPLGVLIQKVKNIFKSLLTQKNIEIEEDYVCCEEKTIYIPLGQTLQIFINILKNAIDALVERTIENPKIIISIEQIDENFIFKIEDNAGGIDENILPEIFNKRFSTKKENGTGLGLDICKSIIEKNLNGKIEASNTQNGALFKITLPV